jgi:toxin-antitoxin system PIN domain toxin
VRLVDANILVYAVSSSFEQHDRARRWLDQRLNEDVPLGLPWPSLVAFVRLMSNPRIFSQPDAVSDAWQQVEKWLACRPVWIPQPTERHTAILGRLVRSSGIRSAHIHDAHLAALALEHGLAVASADADFSRFSGLKWENPLE